MSTIRMMIILFRKKPQKLRRHVAHLLDCLIPVSAEARSEVAKHPVHIGQGGGGSVKWYKKQIHISFVMMVIWCYVVEMSDTVCLYNGGWCYVISITVLTSEWRRYVGATHCRRCVVGTPNNSAPNKMLIKLYHAMLPTSNHPKTYKFSEFSRKKFKFEKFLLMDDAQVYKVNENAKNQNLTKVAFPCFLY